MHVRHRVPALRLQPERLRSRRRPGAAGQPTTSAAACRDCTAINPATPTALVRRDAHPRTSRPSRPTASRNDQSHTVGTVLVLPDGTLFVGNGDSTSFDPATGGGGTYDPTSFYAQDVNSLRGKIFHVDSNGNGVSTNPFWNGDPQRGAEQGLRLRPAQPVPLLAEARYRHALHRRRRQRRVRGDRRRQGRRRELRLAVLRGPARQPQRVLRRPRSARTSTPTARRRHHRPTQHLRPRAAARARPSSAAPSTTVWPTARSTVPTSSPTTRTGSSTRSGRTATTTSSAARAAGTTGSSGRRTRNYPPDGGFGLPVAIRPSPDGRLAIADLGARAGAVADLLADGLHRRLPAGRQGHRSTPSAASRTRRCSPSTAARPTTPTATRSATPGTSVTAPRPRPAPPSSSTSTRRRPTSPPT